MSHFQQIMGSIRERLAQGLKQSEQYQEINHLVGELPHPEHHLIIVDQQGRIIFYPSRPRLEGRNFRPLLDHSTGESIWEQVASKLSAGGGWTEFVWSHPRERDMRGQRMYVENIDSRHWMGMGFFY